jgi:hypothetical protein
MGGNVLDGCADEDDEDIIEVEFAIGTRVLVELWVETSAPEPSKGLLSPIAGMSAMPKIVKVAVKTVLGGFLQRNTM